MASVVKVQANSIITKDGKLYLYSPTEDGNGTLVQLAIVNKDVDTMVDRNEPSVMTVEEVLSNNGDASTTANSSKNVPIWTGKKDKRQLAVDREATIFFLESLKQKWSLLFDGKTKKKAIWEAVGTEMANHHYDLGENGGQKCEQKWNNLYRRYKEYVKECEKAGTEEGLDDLKSPYHIEILAILGEENNLQPSWVSDSLLKTPKPETSLKRRVVAASTSAHSSANKRKQIESDDESDEDDTESEVEEIRVENSKRKTSYKTKRKKTKSSKSSTVEDIMNILKDNIEYERKRDEERKHLQKKLDKERKEREKRRQEEFKDKERAKMQRHTERMSLAKAMVKAILKNKNKKSKEPNDDSSSDDLLVL